jgi:hypothetical protein
VDDLVVEKKKKKGNPKIIKYESFSITALQIRLFITPHTNALF